MAKSLLVAKNAATELELLPELANRHGLIAGATGTGKTVTLQRLAHCFSSIGVPVFLSDVKGDLAGLAKPGGDNAKVAERMKLLGLDLQFEGCPVVFWDVFGEKGHPVRATISDMGPLVLARMLELNETQQGVLTLVFKIADDSGLLLLDSKDLRAMLQFAAENAGSFTMQYGNITTASIGAIQRGLLALESQGGERFFGEPMLDIGDLMRSDARGRGVINILSADRLLGAPRVYATFLLWMLAELFERLPEVGDPEKPTIVFFFDEAHLLFADVPKTLLDKIEQVVRLIRSKGVGVYFATQNPLDIPESVLGQLGNRVQHAMRAFTPKDSKAVKAIAETLRSSPDVDAVEVITQLAVGEALVSLLDTKGSPAIVERAFIVPPPSHIGPIDPAERKAIIDASAVRGRYERLIDRESAYEKLRERTVAKAPDVPPSANSGGVLNDLLFGKTGPRGGKQSRGLIEAMATSAARSIGSNLGRQILRGVLGSILSRSH